MAENEDQPPRGSLVRSLAVCGIAGLLGLLALAVFVAVALPSRWSVRQRTLEKAALADLRAIAAAEKQYHDGAKAPGGQASYATLDALGKANLVDAELASGKKGEYLFQAAPSTTTPEQRWWGVARPETPGDSGRKIYYVNQEGTVYECPFAGGEHDPGLPDPRTCALPKGLSPARD